MKVLLFDLETAPCVSYSWGLYNELTSTSMIKEDWYVLCWCAKWLGGKEVFEGRAKNGSDFECMKKLHGLMNEADVLIAQNGDNFDIKKANTRFIIHGLTPPSPSKSIDTLKIARRNFKFTSNRLDDLGNYLGVGRKLETGGIELWKRCMAGDKEAMDKMVRYCRQDVILLERVYNKLKPYSKDTTSLRFLNGFDGKCRVCGSKKVQSRGYGINGSGKYHRFQCMDCGAWSRTI